MYTLVVLKKEQIVIRVTTKFKNRLEKLALKNDKNLSDFIRYEMEKLIENDEKLSKLEKMKDNQA